MKRAVPFMPDLILGALKERKVFIGYYMLCRYLNGKGYKRFGCNAGYDSKKENRIDPCPVLCPGTKIYRTKIYYWCKKLEKEGKLYLKKRLYYDSKNPYSKSLPHKLDFFVFICQDKIEYDMYLDLEEWIK
ncbi:MAG: hypothetical protein QIT40_gp25 [Lokiarchaeia virus VerdaV4]|uniref:Uncharacterized protein n=1 Tax=Lokiarchaeia virus VerdaV4 TaxID=3070172 RepID=A0AA35CNS6_9CAUD|nr:MAG: hypothetical protein QIT40_gp25 [Lokiarchaeia virus VerdaV4]BDI54983.1 MAG: hypothetical protein [Lokiarchaeia virus VerdaV4]